MSRAREHTPVQAPTEVSIENDGRSLASPRTITVEPGVCLAHRGHKPDCACYIDQGRVALGVMGGHAHLVQQWGVIEGPCWLDPAAVLLRQVHVLDAVAETAVVYRRLPLAALDQPLADAPQHSRSLIHELAQALRQQAFWAVSRLFKDADARCAEWLLMQAQAQSAESSSAGELRTVTLVERKRVVAAQLGIAPETFSRVLKQLREQGLVASTGRLIQILDWQGLQHLAGL